MDGHKDLEILEIEFFPPVAERSSENSDNDKDQKIQELLKGMKQYGIDVSDILNFKENQDQKSEDKVREELDGIARIGNNVRGRRILSNEEMIRRAKYLANARAKKQAAEVIEEKVAENSTNEIDVQKEIDALGKMGDNLRKKRESGDILSNEEMLANAAMLKWLSDNPRAQKFAENLLNRDKKQNEAPKTKENLPIALNQGGTYAQQMFARMQAELEARNNGTFNEGEKSPKAPEALNENTQLDANQLLTMAILSLVAELNDLAQKGKLKAVDVIERIKGLRKASPKKSETKEEVPGKENYPLILWENPEGEKSKNSDNSSKEDKEKPAKNSDSIQINEEGKKFLEQQVSNLWDEIVKARQILEDSKTEGGKALSPVAYKNIEESINNMIEARKKLQGKQNEFTKKINEIDAKLKEFNEGYSDLSIEIAKMQAQIDEKNEKLNALKNPTGIRGKFGSLWNKAKSFITRRPSKIDTLMAEKEKLEKDLKTTQNALVLVENKQKELQAKKTKLLNDFTHSL